MAENTGLKEAKAAKKDEFYTQMDDIAAEMWHYKQYFDGATILCNCDDPFESNFFKYFALNFHNFGLKKLIATCYDGSPVAGQELSFDELKSMESSERKAYKIELTDIPDMNGDGTFDLSDIEAFLKSDKCPIQELEGNGDFRSEECIDLLKKADIVVTNPPFSLFREYVSKLLEYQKKFIIIGNINAVTYKEIFPLIKENKIWIGVSIHSGDRKFYVPDNYPLKAAGCGIDSDGRRYIRVKGIRWYTNLDIEQRHEELILYKHYSPEEYPNYFNYDGIDVSTTSDIPCDYAGIMGVPITFLDVYNPEQFEIIGGSPTVEKKFIHMVTENKKTIQYIDRVTGEVKWTFPYSVSERKIGNGLRIEKDGKPSTSPYWRILIRNKFPKK